MMAMKWVRAFGAATNLVLGFQPAVGGGGAVTAPRSREVEGPKLSWLDRLDRWFWRQEQKRCEAYLAGSTDRVDLELRMRNLERARDGGFL